MAMLSKPYPTSQYAATYRMPQAREHHGFFASPTESEFSEHFDSSPLSVKAWDELRVADWLKSINCSQYIEIFTSNNINGANLMELDRTTLRELGVKRVGDQIRIATQAKAFRKIEYKHLSKVSKNRVCTHNYHLSACKPNITDSKNRNR
jgi:mitogen-activated protein kinase kinase kinase